MASPPAVAIGGRRGAALALSAPVLNAAGCAGDLGWFARGGCAAGLGALVTATLTLRPRSSGPSPRVYEARSGLFYQAASPNPGLDGALRRAAAAWARLDQPVIVSIAADSAAELATLGVEIEPLAGVAAFEINAVAFVNAGDVGPLQDLIDGLTTAVTLPVAVKLVPGERARELAVAAVDAGADALCIGHGWPALGPHGADALLAGPAVLPLTLQVVEQVAGAVTVPVIACGGITSPVDVMTYGAAGASAVQIGSMLLRDPFTATRIAAELSRDGSGLSPRKAWRSGLTGSGGSG